MEAMLLELGLRDGIFAGLFIALLVYVLRTSKEREEKSNERENKLYVFLDGMKDEFSKLVGNYEKLSNDVNEIRVDIEATRTKLERVEKKHDNGNS